MALKRSKSFSMVFLAMATLLVLAAGGVSGRPARGGDVCQGADNVGLCRSVVKGQKSPVVATRMTLRQLMVETATAARKAEAGKKKSRGSPAEVFGVCLENYEDAMSSLKRSQTYMAARDKGSFNSFLSAALTDYVTCEDTFAEMGLKSPLAKNNGRLRQMAGNALFLATRWH